MDKKINKKQLTEVLEQLGYSFYPFEISIPEKDREFPNKYNLYMSNDQIGLEYVATFNMVFNDNNEIFAFVVIDTDSNESFLCNDYNEMLETIKTIQENSKYPIYCFDPFLSSAFKLERLFNWYTKNVLGFDERHDFRFSYTSSDTVCKEVCLFNLYGEEMFSIELHVKNDNDLHGMICRPISSTYSLISREFTGFDDMISAINSIVGPDVLTNASKNIAILQNIKSDIDMSKIQIAKVNNFNLNIKSAKDLLKGALSDALALLNT